MYIKMAAISVVKFVNPLTILSFLQSLAGSVLVELDSNSEKLRQKEGWYHWVAASAQEGTESSTDTGYSTTSSSAGGTEYSILGLPGGEVSPLHSAAPSEASESILVSVPRTYQGGRILSCIAWSELQMHVKLFGDGGFILF